MKYQIIDFLRDAFPFLTVLFLWRLATPFWNPGGVLAFIPIFYCTFVLRTPWFAPYAVLFCFLIDYKFDTTPFWTALYCFAYSVYGFQTVVDLSRMEANALRAFAVFFGVVIFILSLVSFNFANVLRYIWLFLWTTALYIPITGLIRGVTHDR